LALLIAGLLLLPQQTASGASPVRGPVIVRPGGANLYAAPEGEVVAALPISTVAIAAGRTAAMDWLWVETATGETGWLRTAEVIAVGVDLLPVVEEGETPAPAVVEETPPAAPEAPTVQDTLTGRVASGDDRLNVREGPGTGCAIAARLSSGTDVVLVGRSEDGAWLQVAQDDEIVGWVAAAYVETGGEVDRLPVVDVPAAATAVPAPVAPAVPQTAATAAAGLDGVMTISTGPGGLFYGYDLATGDLWPLTSGFDPAISPDGQTVAFVRDGGENGIYLIDVDGSHERLIFSGRTRLSSPKWSPDGEWILFTRSDNYYRCIEIGSACVDGFGPPGGGTLRGPDGEELVQTTRYRYNLARVDRNGENYRDIGSLETARAADWNRAGIVYQSAAGLQITADTPDAQNQLVVFDYLKPYYDDPDWQPDGGQIVYMGKEASHYELFVINPDGSGQTALTRPATTLVDELPSNVAPVWSPDGQQIAFLSNRTASGEAGAWQVWVMDAGGGDVRRVPVDLGITYTYGGEQVLSWGP
jgi:hypothetical protein